MTIMSKVISSAAMIFYVLCTGVAPFYIPDKFYSWNYGGHDFVGGGKVGR